MYRRLINWLTEQPEPPSTKRAARNLEPMVDVYYWDGAVPAGHPLRDLSLTGAYLYTSERWYIGTIVRLLLQKRPAESGAESGSASIASKVVRHGEDGVGLEFVFSSAEEREMLARLIAALPGQGGAGSQNRESLSALTEQ